MSDRRVKIVSRKTVDADALYHALGARIRQARTHANWSQADLAFAIGLTRTSVTNLEAGGQRINVAMLYNIALALNIRPSHLIVWNEPWVKR